MEDLLGLLRIRVIRGINLAIRDVRSSDPYIVVRMGKQLLKTRVVRKNVNPEWNEDLTLSVADPIIPIKLQVFDKDTSSLDDKMGDAEFDIGPFIEAVSMRLQDIPSGTIITNVKPSRENCLAEESDIVWEGGKVKQHMFLRLRNLERGDVELQLEWIDVPGSRGLSRKMMPKRELPHKSTGFQRHGKQRILGSSMEELRDESDGHSMHHRPTKRILQEIEAVNEQLLKYSNQVDIAITRELQRSKISPELLICVEEAKELHKRASDSYPNSDGLVDSYFQIFQHLKDFDSENEQFNIEWHIRHFELSWRSPEITGMSSKIKKVHKMEITANSSNKEKVQRMDDVNKFRQLSDEGTSLELIPLRGVSSMLVKISVEGELSHFVDINLEMRQGPSPCKWQNPHNGFLCWDFLSGKENYRIHVLEFGRGESSDRNYSSQEPVESFDFTNSMLPKHLFFRNEGERLTNYQEEDQWRQAGVIVLTDNTFPSLPEKPDSPNLVLLFLQRSPSLISTPDSVFSNMPSLRVVDLSDTRIRSLPSSLLGLHKLQVLYLRNCSFLYRLPPDIKALKHIEVLDLSGTELESVPDELGQLENLRHLQVSFYGTDDERECDQLPSILLSPQTISNLRHLEALSIVVHPEDSRWVRNAKEIMQKIGYLEHLSYIDFYFPKVEIMEQFTQGPSWKRIGTNKFRFVVGQDVKRIVDRVSGDMEYKFNEQDRCLRFVNGKEVSEAVEKVLNYVTAFYLDHHSTVCSLSVFGITNCNKLLFCVVRECPNIEVIISEKTDEPAYPALEYLGLYYLWKLESISKDQLPRGSFRALKSLTVDTCPKLRYIFSESLVQCFCNLEELIVEDCESLKEIIENSDKMGKADFSALPRLKKVKLYYLPQLFRLLWEGEMSLEDPLPSRGFQLESVTLYSCPKLNRSLLKPVVEELIEKDYKQLNRSLLKPVVEELIEKDHKLVS